MFGQKFNEFLDNTRRKIPSAAFGVCEVFKTQLICGIDNFVLYVVADHIAAKAAKDNIENLSGLKCANIISKDEVLMLKKAAGRRAEFERLSALYKIITKKVKYAVITVQSLMQIFPDSESFKKNIISLEKDTSYNLHDLGLSLINCGYKREERALDPGQFCLHGDILDIYSIENDFSYRLEFFGDNLESIKKIDADNYTSFGSLDKIEICPAREFFCSDKIGTEEKINAELNSSKLSPDNFNKIKDKTNETLEILKINEADPCLTYLLPYSNYSKISDYLPEGCVVVFDEPKLLEDKREILYTEHDSRFENLLINGQVLPSHYNQCVNKKELFDFKECSLAAFNIFASTNNIFSPKNIINFNTVNVPKYYSNLDNILNDIKHWKISGYKILIMAQESDAIAASLMNMQGVKKLSKVPENFDGIGFIKSSLQKGYIYHDEKIIVLANQDISKKKKEQTIRKNSTDVFSDLSTGDYIVHETHGIGKFKGMTILKGNLGQKEYLTVEFKDGDNLHIPCDQLDILSKYSGGDKMPKLSKLGGKEFLTLKEKVRKSLKELAINLKLLYAEREQKIGFQFSADTKIQKDFEDSFEFEETPDQLRCIEEIKKDMESERVMDRLLCGDVGYGKTEVALRAALKAVLSGKQVAILSPTTILSEQHYNVLLKRLENTALRIGVLNRFCSAKQQKETLQALKDGKIDIISATHRLLSNDIVFSDLGLLIVDEEQRFGVVHKEKIKLIKKNVDVLTMTATPIPRTLHMSLSGIRDISIIETPPGGRIPPQTYVMEYSDELIADAINKEIGRGGQAFVLYNKVESIDGFAAKIKRLIPQARVAVAHGQMDADNLEKTVFKFYNNEFDVLVCTTIIENGIDIPNANTLIVYEADKFGLSQLYQLKGRVGRSTRLAYVYFTFLKDKILQEAAYKRLQAITEFTELGSGFKIAMRDLEIRGAGSVLGSMQSGHIEKIGYDMYIKILKEENNKLKGIYVEKRVDMDIDMDAYIPDTYIDSEDERIKLYQALSFITDLSQVDETLDKLNDIYGYVPDTVKNLINISAVKFLAGKLGVSNIVIKKAESYILLESMEKLDNDKIISALENKKDSFILTFTDKPKIVCLMRGGGAKLILKSIYEFLFFALK